MIIIFIYDENYFYKIIRSNPDELQDIIDDKESCYTEYEIRKKGGVRHIHSIDRESKLYTVQKNLLNKFLSNIPVSDNAHGFIKGLAYKSFLEQHIRDENIINKKEDKDIRYFLRLDLKDFFSSFRRELVEEVISYYIKINDDLKKSQIIDFIIEIITLDGKLPQGAVTSPTISNICFRQFDQRIQKYCDKFNVIYTRYADDMLFSTYDKRLHEPFFKGMISKIIQGNFKINNLKTKQCCGSISLNGFIISDCIKLSRSRLSDINRIFYLYNFGGQPENVKQLLERLNKEAYNFRAKESIGKENESYFKNRTSILNYLTGYRSFLIDWFPKDKEEYYYEKLESIVLKIEKIVNNIIELP